MDEEEYTPTWSREALLAGQAALDEIADMSGTGNGSNLNLLEAMFNDPRLAGIDSYFLPDEEYPYQKDCSPDFLPHLLEGGKLVSTSQIAYDMRIAVAQGDQQAVKYLAKNCFLDTTSKYHFFDQLGCFDDTGIDVRAIAKALASEIDSELEVMAEEGY